MPNYNKVLLMGNLTRDVELKYTPSNMAVANLGLAINRRYKGGDGEMKEETTFVDCEAWGSTAENISKWFSKGKPIFVEGRLKLEQWQDKEGQNRSRMRVVIENFQFVDSKGSGGGGESQGSGNRSAPRPQGAYSGSPSSSGATHEPVSDDDIPF